MRRQKLLSFLTAFGLSILAVLPTSARDIHFFFYQHQIVNTKGVSFSEARVSAIERNISAFLTAIDGVGTSKAEADFTGVNMTRDAREDVNFFCENFGLDCKRDTFRTIAMNDAYGFQVMGIDVTFTPKDTTYHGNCDKQFTISFNADGQISGINTSISNHSIQTNANFTEVTEQERLNTIRKFVENFRQYYEQKDIASLRRIYSDDAIIVTGRVVRQRKGKGDFRTVSDKVEYKKEDKETYLNRLENVTFKKRYINVGFDQIKVDRCGTPGKTNFYGVTLKQTWETPGYNDEGYLFLLWEFDETGKEPPVVHVRTWQPLEVNPRERFNLFDFDF